MTNVFSWKHVEDKCGTNLKDALYTHDVNAIVRCANTTVSIVAAVISHLQYLQTKPLRRYSLYPSFQLQSYFMFRYQHFTPPENYLLSLYQCYKHSYRDMLFTAAEFPNKNSEGKASLTDMTLWIGPSRHFCW